MNMIEATAVLDRVKDGQDVNPRAVSWALVMTGDLDESEYERIYAPVRGSGVAVAVSKEGSGVGQT